MEKIEFNLDSVLTEIGEFGRFQTQIYVSVILPVLLVSFFCSSYIFTMEMWIIGAYTNAPCCAEKYLLTVWSSDGI